MHADDEVELLHTLPERVELGQRERLAALPRGNRGDADQEDLGAPLGDVLELGERDVVARGEADDRRGEDGVGVDVGPVLVHPLVERVDHHAHPVGVVRHALLERARERGPQQRAVDAHLLHELEARLGVEEGVEARHRHHLPEAGARARTVESLAALGDVHARTAGHRDPVERGVGDVVGDLVLDGKLGAAVDVDVPDDPLVLVGEELRERVAVLVEVVVGVEGGERQLAVDDLDVLGGGHGLLPLILDAVQL